METRQKNQSGCGLGAKFGSNWVQCYEKSEEMDIINSFSFHSLRGECFLKQKVVVVQTPEWKFKANVAKNAKFLLDLGQKWQKTNYL